MDKTAKNSTYAHSSHFVLGDLRKFAEQYGDIIQWNESNRAYILTHGVSGVEWSHYKHPLPEYVYDDIHEVLEQCLLCSITLTSISYTFGGPSFNNSSICCAAETDCSHVTSKVDMR